MRAQVVLTPAESKKLIAMAVARMDVVKQAAEKGMVVIHPSSSTFFIIEELTKQKPTTNVWVCGIVVPKGTCVELATMLREEHPERNKELRYSPDSFRHSWVIKGGELHSGIPLGTILEEMRSDDVYIKGVNALDTEGTVGVLTGNRVESGTIGRVMNASKKKGFKVIFPVGLEKLVPIPIREASKEARKGGYDYCMGINCNLLPCQGIVVTEVNAVEILSGAQAIPIAAGGLGGAEGAVVLVVKGGKEQVSKAIEYIEAAKGANLPQVRIPNCYDCKTVICDFPVRGKHWA